MIDRLYKLIQLIALVILLILIIIFIIKINKTTRQSNVYIGNIHRLDSINKLKDDTLYLLKRDNVVLSSSIIELQGKLKAKDYHIIQINKEYEEMVCNIRTLPIDEQLCLYSKQLQDFRDNE